MIALVLSVGLQDVAHSQWIITNLHPEGALSSRAYGTDNGQQVGNAVFGSSSGFRASLWYGTSLSWVNLHPGGAAASQAYGIHNGQAVGYVQNDSTSYARASLWESGISTSVVNLHPTGSDIRGSTVYGIHNGQQAGNILLEGDYSTFSLATSWGGAATSYVDLSGFTRSVALAVHDGVQVGYADFTNAENGWRQRARLWSGTAESEVDLHPDYDVPGSAAFAIHNGQQVGFVGSIDVRHASLWRGTAESWVDINPAEATSSEAYGVHDGLQVGYATFDDVQHAVLWSGTADSAVDLSLALSGSWGNTVARDIWSDGNTIFVAGYGFNNATGRDEALLWAKVVPEPTSLGALVIFSLVARRRRIRAKGNVNRG